MIPVSPDHSNYWAAAAASHPIISEYYKEESAQPEFWNDSFLPAIIITSIFDTNIRWEIGG